ncbi:MAG: thrombospondin, type 1 repeat protein [uncultured bacterium (gcode 4)]|uniref:Thrombospondin, type 1 repeat protein n=1 Tax=uncultured bacterium (gcode 4) TaxID=1234023 RepID=K2GFW3_9BACT|nr:MAG: thrombospondin, type 1 repeat protein [uncultured bacterium (gcode 4)]
MINIKKIAVLVSLFIIAVSSTAYGTWWKIWDVFIQNADSTWTISDISSINSSCTDWQVLVQAGWALSCQSVDCYVPSLGTIPNWQSKVAYQSSTVPFWWNCADISQVRKCTYWNLDWSYTNASCSVSPAANCTWTAWWTILNWSSVTWYSTQNPVYPATCSTQTRLCSNWTLWWTFPYASCTQAYTYSWTSWAYGSCSVSCWWGTQTRTVACQRNDWQIVPDSNCTWAKPATSQSCNTLACAYWIWQIWQDDSMYCSNCNKTTTSAPSWACIIWQTYEEIYSVWASWYDFVSWDCVAGTNYYTNTDYTLPCPATVAIWYRCWWWVVAQVWATSQTKVIAFPSDEPDQKWALVENYATNITSISDWQYNTNLLMSKSATNFPAAKQCYDKVGNWKSDWFLPAWDQLDALHTNSATIWWFTSSNYYSSSLYSWYSWWSVYIWDWYWTPHIYSPNTDLRHVRCVRNF